MENRKIMEIYEKVEKFRNYPDYSYEPWMVRDFFDSEFIENAKILPNGSYREVVDNSSKWL